MLWLGQSHHFLALRDISILQLHTMAATSQAWRTQCQSQTSPTLMIHSYRVGVPFCPLSRPDQCMLDSSKPWEQEMRRESPAQPWLQSRVVFTPLLCTKAPFAVPSGLGFFSLCSALSSKANTLRASVSAQQSFLGPLDLDPILAMKEKQGFP